PRYGDVPVRIAQGDVGRTTTVRAPPRTPRRSRGATRGHRVLRLARTAPGPTVAGQRRLSTGFPRMATCSLLSRPSYRPPRRANFGLPGQVTDRTLDRSRSRERRTHAGRPRRRPRGDRH